MFTQKQVVYHAFIQPATAAFIEGAYCAWTKSSDSASIYGVKMSNRFSCETFSLVDGDYRRKTSVRLENCNNNGDFASICPQWVHAARSAAVVCSRLVNTWLVYIIFLVPLEVHGYLLFFILFLNFPERTCESSIMAGKY